MEIERDFYQKLIDWKLNKAPKSALLIEGARRIGKSTIAEKLGKEHYKSYIIIDFNIASKKTKENFEENLNNLDIFFQNIALEYNTRLYPRESLIIFDEIQKYPRAREAIKYLVKDGRFDYIETGSLISIKENVNEITIPSEEYKLKMYPVTFKEFAIYMNEEVLIDYIKDCFKEKKALANHYHERALRLFKEYLLVGGMPTSIVAYKENGRSFEAADEAKRLILDLYRDDIKKAASHYNSRVSLIFDNIPGFLTTHEKKIVLNQMKEDESFSKYDDPLFWLEDSMICNLCYKCNDPSVGLALNKNNSEVKCFMGDTGLLVSLAFSENEIASQQLYKCIMNDKLSLNKGMLYENMIAQMLVSMNRKLYFYNEYSLIKHRNDMEIDFLISNESKLSYKLYPIEVKSSKNYHAISLGKFKDKFKNKISTSYLIHPKAFKIEDDIIYLPPYMVWCLNELDSF